MSSFPAVGVKKVTWEKALQQNLTGNSLQCSGTRSFYTVRK